MEAMLSSKKSSGGVAVADAPSFFLFEASADSDSVLGDRDSASLGDDDAESCSWDSTDQCPSANFDDDEVVTDRQSLFDDDRRFGLDDDDREEVDQGYRDDHDDQIWNVNNGGEMIGRPRIDRHKSSVSVDSATKELEMLSEVEKNRLFWEACLAS